MVRAQSILSSNSATLDLTSSKKNNFKVIFNQNEVMDLYGHTVTPFDAIVMRGLMPDNNIASLRLLKSIGGQLAFLERLEAEDAKKANPDNPSIEAYYQSLPPHIALTRQVDKAINAHTARLLHVMGKIEQVRSSTMTSTEREALGAECRQVFDETIEYMRQLNGSHADDIVAKHCDDMISKLDSQRRSFLASPLFIDNATPIDINVHQRLFRTVLRHYESLEGTVSAWDGVRLNRSCTEAYQDASRDLQNHIYSIQMPNDAQLWRLPKTGKATLDTALYNDKFERDKLLFTLSAGDVKPLEIFDVNKQAMHQQQREAKAKSDIDDRLEDKSEHILGDFKKNLQSEIEVYQAKHPDSRIELDVMSDILNRVFNKSHGECIYTVPQARELHLHKAKDLYSAIGHAAEEMSSYFSQEMAAKHPGLTFAFFSLTASTFGASALVATNTLTHFASQYLHIVGEVFHKVSGGKLSAAAVQQAFLVAEKNWIAFTHADTLAKSLFMDVIVLPKLTFVMSELLFSKRLDKTTLNKIVDQFQKDELLYRSDKSNMSELLLQSLVVALGMGLTAASGILFNYLTSLPIFHKSNSGFDNSFSKFNFLPDILPDTFASIATEKDILFEMIAVVSVIFSLKIKDLASDKMLEIGQQIFKKNEDPALVVHTEMLGALYRLYLDDRLSFGKVTIAMEEIEKVNPGTWKAIQSSANTLRKEIPQSVAFIQDDSFWDALNEGSRLNPTKNSLDQPPLTATALKLFRQTIKAIGRAILSLVGPLIGTVYTLALNPVLTIIAWGVFRIIGKPRTFKQAYFAEPFAAEMFYQAAKLGRAVSGIINAVWNMFKVLANSSYRTVFLGLKLIVTGFGFTALCMNAVINGKIRQGVGAFLSQIGSMISRGILRVGSGLVQTVFGVVRGFIVGIMAIAPSILSIGLLPFAIGAVISGALNAFRAFINHKLVGEAFKEGYLSMFHDGRAKQLSDFVVRGFLFIKNETAFIGQFSHAIFEPMNKLRQTLRSREDRVENDLLNNPGATAIRSMRDRALAGFNTVQAWGKNGVGRGINFVRTLLVRSVEAEIQRYGTNVKDNMPDIMLASTQSSAALIHSMIGLPKAGEKKNTAEAVKATEENQVPPVAPTDGMSSRPLGPRTSR